MGLPKLSAEEARKRRKESRRKWRMKPEAKQKRRETEKKRQTIYRALGKSEDCRKNTDRTPLNMSVKWLYNENVELVNVKTTR
ncbi:hypothetical protein TNCT_206431 [Trichonephila clavata]|uniref:Uncharacterized protein n=1 Tax=Trichonephila clavata TaxID=2740835 RepID=A0A8X6HKI0_TRICU|nr:hypothetical protein TNCT_206431 [Trichonephila clavata]